MDDATTERLSPVWHKEATAGSVTDVADYCAAERAAGCRHGQSVSGPANRGRAQRLYLAGPMSGKPYYNSREFDLVGRILRLAGYEVVSPRELDLRSGFDAMKGKLVDHEWRLSALERDCREIKRCDGVALLDDWDNSSGAMFEVGYAQGFRIPVLHWRAWLAIAHRKKGNTHP